MLAVALWLMGPGGALLHASGPPSLAAAPSAGAEAAPTPGPNGAILSLDLIIRTAHSEYYALTYWSDGLRVKGFLGRPSEGPALPAVIFVTAYDEYAIQAFEAGAVDYLLKPATDERLSLAIERLQAKLATPPRDLTSVLSKLAEKLGIPRNSIQRARAAILFLLERMAEEGHVYVPFPYLESQFRDGLEQSARELHYL